MIAAGAIARIVGPGGQREVPVEEMCTGPGKTSLAKGEIVASVFLPRAPAAHRRRLSALHPAHRDGHRGGRRRRQPHARRARRLHRGAGRARRGRAAAAAGDRGGRRADRHARSTTARSSAWRRPLPPPAGRSTTSAAPGNTGSRSRACWRGARPKLRSSARGRTDGESTTSPRPSTATRSSSCASPSRRCSTCCATSST